MVDLNATAAAVRAGYSKKTANRIGPRLLSNVVISEIIAQRMKQRSEELNITADAIVRELAAIAFLDPRKVFRWGPDGVDLIDSDAIDEQDARAVSEVSQTTTKDGGSIKARLHDKVRALELLGKHLGVFAEPRTPIDVGVHLIVEKVESK